MPRYNAVQFSLFDYKEPARKVRIPRLTLSLRDLRNDRVSLDVLLDQALDVLNPPGSRRIIKAPWLAQQAVRAVCEAVVADNCLRMPVEIYRPYKHAAQAPRTAAGRKTVTANLEEHQHRMLAFMAEKEGVSVGSLIRAATREKVQRCGKLPGNVIELGFGGKQEG